MAPKRKGKKGKKGELSAARLEAERLAREAEVEARRKREADERERERKLKQRAEELVEREQTVRADELLVKERARKLDEEVTARAARQVKEAEARESAAEKRMKLREAEIANAEARYANAEGELQMRLVEVRAREAALGDGVVGGIAERLEKMLEEQMDVRDVALSRTKQIEAARAELEAKEAALMDSVAQKEAALARAEEAAAHRIAERERKLTQQDFTLKRRLGRRIKEAEALCEAHRAECSVRDRRFKAREEEIRRRSRELQLLLRKVRRLEAETTQRPGPNQPPPPALENHHQHQQQGYYSEEPLEHRPQRLIRPATAPGRRPPYQQEAPDQDPASSYDQDDDDGQPETHEDEDEEPLVDVSASYPREAATTPQPRAAYRPQTAPSMTKTKNNPQAVMMYRVDGSPKNDVERARDQQADEAALATSEQFKALIRHVHAMEDDLVDELKKHHPPQDDNGNGGGHLPEADVKTAIRDVNAAERMVLCAEGVAQQPSPTHHADGRPYAARHLPLKTNDAFAGAPSPAPIVVEDGDLY